MTTKKNIVSQEDVNEYVPPRLVKAQQGWYVVFYHQVNGLWVRERKTFNLNRIRDKRRRLERAREVIEQLEGALINPRGGVVEEIGNVLGRTPVIEAIDFVTGLKMQSPKKDTRKSFKSIRDMLVRFVEKKRLQSLAIADFDVRHAQGFLDECLLRGISNTTFNNYRGFSVILFNTLIKREYLTKNPFLQIDKRENEEKRRRPFTEYERGVVLSAVYQKDYWLFLLVMLHFLELFRRTECYRLRFQNFNLQEGYIFLPKTATKNKKQGVVTIPDVLLEFLKDERFTRQPGNYLIFGKDCQPHPSIPAGEQSFKERHRRLLKALQKAGKLGDITGLSLYSWKDTGMTELAKILRPIDLRDHARHASIDQSLTYYHSDKVLPSVKKAKVKTF